MEYAMSGRSDCKDGQQNSFLSPACTKMDKEKYEKE